MLIGKYDHTDNTMVTLFIKAVSYLFVSIWCVISSELGGKVTSQQN